ncbi:VCBS repeat-containing protein, partial [Massilia sp. MP_M2]|uniref:Ig-like domain-containing protein n=1 Tax=Massilia sp. MP_M2 TaxID=3071713 RepID=UPI00319DFC03
MMLDGAMAMDAVATVTEQATMAPDGVEQDASSPPESPAGSAMEPQAGPLSNAPAAPGQTAWVFIDGSLPGLSDLLAQVPVDATVVLLNPARDGLAQVNEALAGQDNVRAIHLLTHGEQGAIMLGSTRLDLANAGDDHAAALATLGTHLAAGADILLYGCEVASSDVVIAGMEKLAFLLDADLAASDDATGAASLGGDWLLEKQSGDIETATLNGGAWVGLLNTLSVNVSLNLNTPLAVPEDSTLAFTGSTLLQLTLSNMLATSTSVELSVAHGSLSFNPLAGVTMTGGDGNQDTSVKLTGSATAINGVLASLTYNADPDYNGSDTLRLAVSQSLLGITSVSTPINIGLNISPVTDIVADSASTLRNQPVVIDVMANDHFERSTAALGSVTQPANGSVTFAGNVVTYTPAPGYAGSDSFTYTVDSGTTTETATVSISVQVPNAPPTVSVPAAASTGEDQPLLFSVANGTALTVADPDGGTLTATLAVTHGTLTLASTAGLQFATGDGTADTTLIFSGTATAINGALEGLRFTPDVDYNGSATLSLAAGDGQASRSASIAISLGAVTDAVNDSIVTGVLTPVTLYPLANDHFEGTATIASVGVAAHGTVIAGPGGSVIYTPDAGYRGSDSFTVTVSAGGVTETETVSVTVGTNQPPAVAAALGGISTQDKALVSASVAVGFSDADLGDTLRFSATGLPVGLSIDAVTGLITGRLDGHASQGSPYSVEITATDTGGLSATATLSITVANPAPIAIAGVALGQEDSNLRIEALLNASDADGDDLRITAATALHGTVTIAPDGALSYTPHANYNGLDSITYIVRDADGASATGNIAVTVAAVADLPSLRLPTIPVFAEDTPLIFASLLGTRIEIGDVDGQVLEIELSVPGGLLTLEQHAGVNISQGDGVEDSIIRMSGTAVDLQAALDQLRLLPGADYNGPLTLTVSLGELGQTLALSATLPLGIAAVADIVDDHVVAVAGQAVGFNVLANDSFEHAGRTVTAFQTPSHGTLTLDGQGNAVYTPSAGFTGTDTFTYTVTSNGTTETASVTITIGSTPNHAPTGASLPDIARNDGAVIALDLSASFADADGDTLTFSASGLPAGLAINTSTGVITGTLASGASSAAPGGVYTITVSASDGRGGLASQAFTLTVANVAPIGAADSAAGSEDGVITGNVLANDSDPDGDALTVDTVPVQGPEHGVLVLNADGSFTYTPDANYNGSDSFTYRIADADGAVTSATVSLTITAVNDATSAATIADRNSTAGASVSFDGAAAFADVDGDTLAYSVTGLPPGLSLDPVTGQITGTPTTPGNYSVTLSAADGNGGNASTSFTWTVTATPNNGPTTVGTLSTETANDAQSVSIATANVFSDADGDTLAFSASGMPAGLTIDAATGVITGTLASSASSAAPGGVYTITVSASDGRGGLASQAFTLTVANVAPIAAADSAAGSEDGVITGNVLANDSDPDADALTVDTVPVQDPQHGVLVLNSDGSFTYTPEANYNGSDSFTYRVTDADGAVSSATVSLTITAVNDAPSAAQIPDRNSTAGASVTFDGAAAFADVDGDTLAYSSTGLPPGLSLDPVTGQVTGTPTTPGNYSVTLSAADGNGGNASTTFTWNVAATPNNGPTTVGTLPTETANDAQSVSIATANVFSDADGDTLVFSASGLPAGLTIDAATGVITGTLASSASGTAPGGVYTITVSASDGRGGMASQAFTLTVANVAPVAAADTAAGSEDGVITGNVLANDSDPDGDALTVDTVPVQGPEHGVLVLNNDGSFTYTPEANYKGSDSFTYRITDADGAVTSATVSLTITAVNDAPSAGPIADRNSTAGASVTFDGAAAFAEVDGDTLVYSSTGLPPGLSLDPVAGQITGTPTTPGNYSVTLSAADGNGGNASTTFTWTVAAAANNGPTTVGTLSTETANDAQSVSIATANVFSDADGDTLAFSASGLPAGLTIDAATGVITGTLASSASAAAPGGVYTITVSASDGRGGLASQAFTLTVANVAPIAAADNAAGSEDGVISGNVLTNDSDPDGDALTVDTVPVQGPVHGVLVLNSDGSFTYTPNPNYNGSDSFTYRVTDADGAVTSATVSLTITAVNDAPSAAQIADRNSTAGASVTFDGAAAFADVDGDTLTYSVIGLPPGLSLDPVTGQITGTPTTPGNYNVTLSAADGNGGNASTTFTWTVAATPNNGPTTVGTLPTETANDAQSLSIATANVFSDADGDTLAFSASGLPTGLTIDAATGVITGTLASSASSAAPGGVYTITVSASDGRGGLASQAFTLTVANVAPIAAADSVSGSEDGVITGNVLANDSDADGDALTVDTVPVQGPQHGVLVLNADGSFTYTPDANYNGSDSFTYRVTDADGAVSSANVSLTITAVNDAPSAAQVAERNSTAGASVTFDGAAAFADVDGDTLAYSSTGLPPGLSLDPVTGQITGTPTTPGNYSVTLSAADGNGGNASTSFPWTVAAAANNGPTTVGTLSTETANDAQSVSITTAGVFSDADGDTLAFSASGLPAGLTIDAATGVITGTLVSGASSAAPGGVYTITVSASDGRGGLASQAFTLTVANVAPIAAADSVSGSEDGVIAGNVLANDSDPDGDALTVDTVPVQGPEHGVLVLNADGSFSYTPNPNYNGSDSFTYRVTDADGAVTSATVSLTITAVNDAPSATPIADRNSTAGASVTFDGAAAFAGVDGDTLVYSSTGLPPGLSLDPATGQITGTPTTPGNYSVTLSAADGNGGNASTTFTWTVAATPNNGPTTVSTLSTQTANDAQSVSIATAGVFSDADGDTLAFSASGLPAGLTIDAATGVITGTLASGASSAAPGGVYTITVSASDGRGGLASQAFTLTVANVAPIAAADSVSGSEDGVITGNVLANDSDADGDALTVDTVPLQGPQHGVLVLNADGSFTYTPDANYNGSDSFTYRVTDADGAVSSATVSLTITAVNDGQSAAPITDRNSTAGATVTFDAAAAFADVDGDTLAYSSTGLPPGLSLDPVTGQITGTPTTPGNYSVTLSAADGNGGNASTSFTWTVAAAANNGPTTVGTLPTETANDAQSVSIATAGVFSDADGDTLAFTASGLPAGLTIDAATGVITGTLASSASGTAPGGVYTITVSASDGRGGMASQAFTLTVANVAPVAAADTAAGSEDGVITGNVLANDSDPDGDALTVDTVPVQGPEHGVLVLNADGSFTYTPEANYNGSDSFTYRVTDADGAVTSATVSLTITAVNDAPSATQVADRNSTAGASVTFDAAAAFADVDGDTLAYSSTGLPPGLSLDPVTGQITGTPTTPGNYSVTLSAADGNGGNASTTFTWTVAATPNNGPTTVGTLSTETANDAQSVSIATAGVFSDADGDTLAFSASGLPTGLTIDAATGVITGTLASSASSAAPGGVYTITVSASDGRGGLASQAFTLTVANIAPIAAADSAAGSEDGVITGNVLANDSDPDADALTVDTVPVQGPQHGVLVLNADGSFSYTPDPNYNGSDSFTYRVTDADGAVTSATVSLTITAVNDGQSAAPIADRNSTAGASVTFDGAAAFADVDGDTLTYSVIGLPPGLSLDPVTGQVTGTPTTPGNYSVTLSAADGNGGNASTTFTWTVAATPNNGPTTIGTLSTETANDAQSVSIATAGVFSDADGDTLAFSASGLPTGLTIDA